MSFGFAGAQGTGKTALAKQVAEDMGFHYHAGLRRALPGNITLLQRIEAEEVLLETFLADLAWAKRPMITDCTPLDLLGSILPQVTIFTDISLAERIDAYAQKCLEATIRHFDTIIILRPMPRYLPQNTAYQSLVQFIIEGAARQIDSALFVHRLIGSDFEKRRDHSQLLLIERMQQLSDNSKAVARH